MINLIALYRSLYDRGYHYFFKEEDYNSVIRQDIDEDWKLHKIIRFFDDPVHIIDNIYLGNAYNAANYHLLEDINIKLIINVTKEIQNYFPENFEYYNIEILDSNNENFRNNFNNVVDYIKKKNFADNENILVHCYMGCSRSVAVILAYIIKFKNINLDEAITIIKNKKNTININKTFLEELTNLNIKN